MYRKKYNLRAAGSARGSHAPLRLHMSRISIAEIVSSQPTTLTDLLLSPTTSSSLFPVSCFALASPFLPPLSLAGRFRVATEVPFLFPSLPHLTHFFVSFLSCPCGRFPFPAARLSLEVLQRCLLFFFTNHPSSQPLSHQFHVFRGAVVSSFLFPPLYRLFLASLAGCLFFPAFLSRSASEVSFPFPSHFPGVINEVRKGWLPSFTLI